MKKYIYLLLPVFVLVLTAGVVKAQFEGKIVYNTYHINSDGEKENRDAFTMYVTPDRILLQGQKNYTVIGAINTEGVLVRLDTEDFVFLTGDDEALKISKTDITSMMNMFGGEDTPEAPPGVSYQQTGETETIRGYACEKFVFTDEENPENYSEVWMTENININWGMLAEPWGGVEKVMGDDFPFNLIFEDGYFPVKVESYEGGRLSGVVEAVEIAESGVPGALVQIPSGVTVLSFQDYLFRRMSRN